MSNTIKTEAPSGMTVNITRLSNSFEVETTCPEINVTHFLWLNSTDDLLFLYDVLTDFIVDNLLRKEGNNG